MAMRSLCLVLAFSASYAFVPSSLYAPSGRLTQLRAFHAENGCITASMQTNAKAEGSTGDLATEVSSAGRRGFLRLAVGTAAAAVVGGGAPFEAGARVYFDTERYGDKELKVALINQVKQQFRALFEKKPELLVPLFKLAMADALTFDPTTNEGGLNGATLKLKDDPKNAYLKPAFEEIERIRGVLLSKTEVSTSDLIAFAGSVAIEATGGPRVKVQLGRIDAKKEMPPSKLWDPKNPTSASVKDAFLKSGMTAQEAVLLAGTFGQLRRAGNAMSTALANKVQCNPDEDDECQSNEEGYFGMYAPVTILSETNRQFGKNRGASAVNSNTGFDSARIAGLAGDAKFSNAYLVSLAKEGPKDKLGEALLGDDELKKWVMEYAKSNSNKFNQDAVKAYLKMVELGRVDAR